MLTKIFFESKTFLCVHSLIYLINLRESNELHGKPLKHCVGAGAGDGVRDFGVDDTRHFGGGGGGGGTSTQYTLGVVMQNNLGVVR